MRRMRTGWGMGGVQGLGQGYAHAAVHRRLRDIQRQALLAAQFLWLGYVERPHVDENMETPVRRGGQLQVDTVDLGPIVSIVSAAPFRFL